MPKAIKKLIQVAKKFTVHLEGMIFIPNITNTMPIWSHIKVKPGRDTIEEIPQKRKDEYNTETVKTQIVTKLIIINGTNKLVVIIYYGKDNPKNSILKFNLSNPDERELGTLIAIYKVVKETSTNALLHIEINHKKVTKMLTSQLKKLEDQGFLLTKYPDQTRALVAELRHKKQDTSFLYKPFTENDPLEDELISLLNNSTNRENKIEANLEARPETTVSGAKLSKLTQATAYKIIRSLKLRQYTKRRQT
jgi:hypothetical protein